jgi:undecaprenyl diphosphate synthase
VAIIMDGNGRWARSRGLPRLAGHRAGVENIRQVLETAAEIGLHVLTIWAFSTENWGRPRVEVRGLMRLLEENLRRELPELHRQGVRLHHSGRLDRLPDRLQAEIQRAKELTADNDRITLNIAFDYGGRADILQAVQRIIADQIPPDQVDEALFARYLWTSELPDPDLIIRTSGEFRVSNFMLWQAAYAEYFITPTLWPDFDKEEFLRALQGFAERDRRFGLVHTSSE